MAAQPEKDYMFLLDFTVAVPGDGDWEIGLLHLPQEDKQPVTRYAARKLGESGLVYTAEMQNGEWQETTLDGSNPEAVPEEIKDLVRSRNQGQERSAAARAPENQVQVHPDYASYALNPLGYRDFDGKRWFVAELVNRENPEEKTAGVFNQSDGQAYVYDFTRSENGRIEQVHLRNMLSGEQATEAEAAQIPNGILRALEITASNMGLDGFDAAISGQPGKEAAEPETPAGLGLSEETLNFLQTPDEALSDDARRAKAEIIEDLVVEFNLELDDLEPAAIDLAIKHFGNLAYQANERGGRTEAELNEALERLKVYEKAADSWLEEQLGAQEQAAEDAIGTEFEETHAEREMRRRENGQGRGGPSLG